MFARFRQRSYQLEHLDIGDYTAQEYEDCLVELRRINNWLGDARALRQSLLQDVQRNRLRKFSVIDVGAGSGELLRVVAAWAEAEKRIARLLGLELNPQAARAIGQPGKTSLISSVVGDALSLPFGAGTFDYAMCSLFTHHFAEPEIVAILRELKRVARRRIFVIDLNRHPLAYFLYTTLGRLFLHNRLIREDGALSILRSFKPTELLQLGAKAGLGDLRVERKFPFRLVLSGTVNDQPVPGEGAFAHAEKLRLAG